MSPAVKRSVVRVARHPMGVKSKENVDCSQGSIARALVSKILIWRLLTKGTRCKGWGKNVCYRCGAPRACQTIGKLRRIENKDIGGRSNAKHRCRNYQLFLSRRSDIVGVPYEKVSSGFWQLIEKRSNTCAKTKNFDVIAQFLRSERK